MASTEPQSYANHRRLDPPYHMVLATILVVNLVHALVVLVRALMPHSLGFEPVWQVVMAFAFCLMALKLRGYPLRAQDRLIRLEERLRMEKLLPDDLKARLPELRPNQFVALRFASDEELADRVRETLDGSLPSEEIKKRIQAWRADVFRV